MSSLLTTSQVTAARRGVIPYITVSGARDAIDWYVDAFGAELHGEPYVMADGRIGHSELELGGGIVYVADESPASHVAGPQPGADATVTLGLETADVDATVARVLQRGATLERDAADNPYGRNAVVRDPFHHRWLISGPVVAADRVRNGDAGYASLWVADVARGERFYGSVLGWSFAPGSDDRGRRVVGQALSQGLWAGEPHTTLYVSYFVDDITEAVARVRAAGGRSTEPTQEPWGSSVDCTDDQGAPFSLFQPQGGDRPLRDRLAAVSQGDLVYITMRVASSSRARAFYAAVFGWDFTAGRFPDAWDVLEPVPTTGLSGGHDMARNVPVYRVDDVAAAVQRVRDAGGTATDPMHQPYGRMADCTDDQGTVFYVIEM